MINYKKFVENSCKWLANYIKANHLQSLVIGVSGGIDSTVSCAIASPVCKELGIPLIGRSLPTTTNKPDEITIAFEVGKAFCTDFKEVPIRDSFNFISSDLVLNEGPITKLQEGNIKARLRMIYLRHLASVHKGVVIDNDNFTEWNLGFYTVGGDQFDVNLGLHYLWKTEIYELADYLYNDLTKAKNHEQANAIWQSMSLIPTDGNGVSSSDCEQFGLDNYEQVDDVLKTMYYDPIGQKFTNEKELEEWNNKHTEEYIRLIDSYNEQGVDKVMILHENSAYKRKKAPIKPTLIDLGI